MFEARLVQGSILKKIIESVKDLVTEANLDCASTGITLQAMDSSHVSLVALNLRSDGFDKFVCEKSVSLGLNLALLSKVLKCADNDDVITIRASDSDSITFMFESKGQEKLSEFEMKLMEIDADHLGIPNTDYKCNIKMPSSEFQKICRDLAVLGETATIACSKEGVKFSVDGDAGTGNITRRQNVDSDKKEHEHTIIDMEEPVALKFALQYLSSFAKATPLSPQVHLHMSPGVPLVVEYPIENMGGVRFYLAPKIEEADDDDE